MFGCGTLVKQHKQGNSNVKDHVRIYHAADILPKHEMDRESLVLFAVLAGGDSALDRLTPQPSFDPARSVRPLYPRASVVSPPRVP